MSSKGRESAERHNALVYARRHLKTHVEWRDFLKAGGDLPAEEIGDLAHHEEAIAELNVICRVLRHNCQARTGIKFLEWLLAEARWERDEAIEARRQSTVEAEAIERHHEECP